MYLMYSLESSRVSSFFVSKLEVTRGITAIINPVNMIGSSDSLQSANKENTFGELVNKNGYVLRMAFLYTAR